MGQLIDVVTQCGEKGILTKEVSLTNRQLLWLFFLSQILVVLPFVIADIYLTNNMFDDCLLANFKCPDAFKNCERVTALFSLG